MEDVTVASEAFGGNIFKFHFSHTLPVLPAIFKLNLNPSPGFKATTRISAINFKLGYKHFRAIETKHSTEEIFILQISIHANNTISRPQLQG